MSSILESKFPVFIEFPPNTRIKIEDSGKPFIAQYGTGIIMYVEVRDNNGTRWEQFYRGKDLESAFREINRVCNRPPESDIEWLSYFIIDTNINNNISNKKKICGNCIYFKPYPAQLETGLCSFDKDEYNYTTIYNDACEDHDCMYHPELDLGLNNDYE